MTLGRKTRVEASEIGSRRQIVLLTFLSLLACIAVPVAARAETPILGPGMSLVFAEAPAQSDGTNVAVRVECLGPASGICSGTVTLTHAGRRATIPVSVQGGTTEPVYVPLRLAGSGGHAVKIAAGATTSQRLGPPSTSAAILRTA